LRWEFFLKKIWGEFGWKNGLNSGCIKPKHYSKWNFFFNLHPNMP